MKNIKFSRSQILRTIRAACIALFFAACAGQANAAPHFSSDFSLSGSTVTVAGSPNNTTSAYFVDASPNTYAFTISSAANIGNTTGAGAGFGSAGDLIKFDNGSVNNAGTLNCTNSTIYITSTSSAVTSSVTNSGSITSTGFLAVDIAGNGTVNNVSGGTISGWYVGVYIRGAGGASSVTNAGSITGATTTNATYAAGVGLGEGLHPTSTLGTSSYYLTNNAGGTISGTATSSSTGSAYAWGVNSGSYAGNIGISNAAGASITGTATNSTGSAYGYGISASSYSGNITVTNNGTATGTGTESAYYQAGKGFGIAASSEFGNVTVTNTGTATGTGSGVGNLTDSGNYSGSGYGISVGSETGNLTVFNSGTASGTGSTKSSNYGGGGFGISASSYEGNITVTNTGTASGTGSATYSGYTEGYGIEAVTEHGNIVVSNGGPNATAMGTSTSAGNYSASAFGISASSYEGGNVTVTNNGTASGTATTTFTQAGGTSAIAYGYGISTASNYGTTTILNNGTATGSGSGYYLGNGFGISAVSDSGSIYITNNGTATGTGTASDSGGTPTASGYGIYAKTGSGYISILNNCVATGTGTATVGGDSASGYGYGIYAQSTSGYISIQNCGTATGTGSGYYLGSGSGIYAKSTEGGDIFIVNNGVAIGNGSSSAYGNNNNFLVQGAGDPAYGYGIYAQSDGNITILNQCNAFGNATSGIEEDGTITDFSTASAYGSGINVRTTGEGSIFINNSGTASGYARVNGSGSAYGYGINVTTTDTASVTINNSGNVFGTGSSYSGTGSGYGIFIGSPTGGDRGLNASPITITNQVSGVIAGAGFFTSRSGSYSSYGIYLQNGTGTATITNKGTISAYYGVGIYAVGHTGPVTVNEIGGAVTTGFFSSTGSAYYFAGPDAIHLGSGVNTVNMVGQVNNTGQVDGGSSGSNTLTMHLAGMTPTQKANLLTAVANTQGGGASGPVFAGGVTYSWVDFNSVSGSFVSLEQAVDPGLMNVATKIDNLPSYLGTAFGPFYVDAASNPEAALNSLVGREFDDALGVISKNDATALSEVFDSRAFDLRSGTGGFDLSGLNITSGSMIASLGDTANMLDRLMGASALGGTKMSDSKEVIAPAANTNRWGAWASGTVTLADESTTDSGPGFNYTTGSPTIGADYRVCNNLAIGALLNFSTTGANFADGSRLGVQTGLGALYGTWSDGPWYANALAGGGYSSYDNHRVTLTGDTASSSPDGDEVLANLTGGYDFKLGGGWTVSPEGGFLYTHVTENGYTESGASAYDLTLGDQNIDSLRSKLGFRVTDNFKWDGIAFTPQIRASWYHEILDDSRGVATSLGAAPTLGSFTVQTNTEGRDFADLGAGLSATPAELSGDVTFFVNYDAQVGQDNFVAHTVNGGLRVNF